MRIVLMLMGIAMFLRGIFHLGSGEIGWGILCMIIFVVLCGIAIRG